MMNQLKTVLLLGALSAGVIGLGALVAPEHLLLFGLLAVAMNLGTYFFSDRLVLRLHRAVEIDERAAPALHADIAELAARAGIPKPRVVLIPDAQPNAFATGRSPEHGVVAVTRGILDLLSRRELRGVLAHELGHIKNRDILVASVAAALSSVVTTVAHALTFSAFLGGGEDDDEGSGAFGFLVALVAPVAATLVQLGISRSREYVADETAARLTGDPEALASALLRLEQGVSLVQGHAEPATASLFIVNPLLGGDRWSRLFSTHPATEDRVERLMALRSRRRRPDDRAHARGAGYFTWGHAR